MVPVISLKGTPAMRDWLAAASRQTGIPAVAIVRRALAVWARGRRNVGTPPEK